MPLREHGSVVRTEEEQEPRTLKILGVQDPLMQNAVLLCGRT